MSRGAIRDWIQSEGKAEGMIPKPTTKTIKHATPVAAGGEPAGVAQESGSSGWSQFTPEQIAEFKRGKAKKRKRKVIIVSIVAVVCVCLLLWYLFYLWMGIRRHHGLLE